MRLIYTYAPYIVADNIDDLPKSLEEAFTVLFQSLREKCPNTEFFSSVFGHFSRSEWFHDNFLKSNPNKCHLLISSNGNITLS